MLLRYYLFVFSICIIELCSAQTFILGQGDNVITTCSGSILDPGGAGNYGDNLNITQTFCSNNGQCLRFSLNELETQTNVDLLRFYDGTSTSSPLIDEVSGFVIPPQITSSSASGGCITVQFISNSSTNFSGFIASISCAPCSPPPETIILGESNTITQVCDRIILDSGGFGAYTNNTNVTQTICSGNGQCVKLSFSEFLIEDTFDRLTIYDGATTDADLLGIFSGTNLPLPVKSSSASGGCMTLVFSSNSSITYPGFAATISCIACEAPVGISNGSCVDALPFCIEAEEGMTFPTATNMLSEFDDGICCLGSTPNPAWYFIKIEDPGSLDILITSGFDVDFICWGPFEESEWQNGVCQQVLDTNQSCLPSVLVDCSFSSATTETCSIPNALDGEYYLLMITNFSNQYTNINFTKTSGVATTDCDMAFCSSTIDLDVSVCDSSTNTYSLSGYLNINFLGINETVTLTNSSGGVLQFTAPFEDTLHFSFNNLASNGALESITAESSGNSFCDLVRNYSAPGACSPCGVLANTSAPICEGEDLILLATAPSSGQFTWEGPNDFSSINQVMTFQQAESSFSGVYTVTYFNPMDSCSSIASVNVLVQSVPEPPIINNNSPICRDSILKLYANFEPYAIYSWAGPNAFESAVQNPIEYSINETFSGEYSCFVSKNGCISETAYTSVEILPILDAPIIFYSSANNTLNTNSDGPFFKWFRNYFLILDDTIGSITPFSDGIYRLEVRNEYGCEAISSNFLLNTLGITQIETNLFSIYPNPSNGEFAIQTEENGNIEMYDVAGKLICNSEVLKGKTIVNIEKYASGFYILKFRTKLGTQFRRIYLDRSY